MMEIERFHLCVVLLSQWRLSFVHSGKKKIGANANQLSYGVCVCVGGLEGKKAV